MRLDTELQDALLADATGGTSGDWSEVPIRARRRSRRRQALQGMAVAAALIVVVGSVAVARDRTDSDTGVEPATTASVPKLMVTLEEGGALNVRSTADGSLVRTLATTARTQFSIAVNHVAVSPDGKDVYFEQAVEDDCSGSASRDPGNTNVITENNQIARVPIAGGPVEVVVERGHRLTLSPDGRFLAFNSKQPCELNGSLEVVEVATGTRTVIQQPATNIPLNIPLTWASNTELVVSRSRSESESVNASGTVTFISTHESVDLVDVSDPTRREPFPIPTTPGLEVLGVRGATGEILASIYPPSYEPPGNYMATLLTFVPGQEPVPLFSIPDGFVALADADPTGDHILAMVFKNVVDDVNAGDIQVYVWSIGEQPRRVESGIAAAFVPESPAP